ncbi:hypothetical protein D3C84_387070 [compost metagenome]
MEKVDEADAHQAQVGQGAAADQFVADQAEVLELVEAPPLGKRPESTPHGRTEVEVTVIDEARRAGKYAVVRLAVSLDQLVHADRSWREERRC